MIPVGRYPALQNGVYTGAIHVLGLRAALGPFGMPIPDAPLTYRCRWAGQRKTFEVQAGELCQLLGTVP